MGPARVRGGGECRGGLALVRNWIDRRGGNCFVDEIFLDRLVAILELGSRRGCIDRRQADGNAAARFGGEIVEEARLRGSFRGVGSDGRANAAAALRRGRDPCLVGTLCRFAAPHDEDDDDEHQQQCGGAADQHEIHCHISLTAELPARSGLQGKG
jgi:hypothetical protein